MIHLLIFFNLFKWKANLWPEDSPYATAIIREINTHGLCLYNYRKQNPWAPWPPDEASPRVHHRVHCAEQSATGALPRVPFLSCQDDWWRALGHHRDPESQELPLSPPNLCPSWWDHRDIGLCAQTVWSHTAPEVKESGFQGWARVGRWCLGRSWESSKTPKRKQTTLALWTHPLEKRNRNFP